MRLASKLIVPVAIAVLAWIAPAETGGPVSIGSVSLRATNTKFGAQRAVTVRASFDASLISSFSVKNGLMAVAVGEVPAVQIGRGVKGYKAQAGGKAKFKTKQRSSAPAITKISVWPVRGQITFEISGAAAGGSPLGQDPAPVTLRFGTTEYFGSIAFSNEPPVGTPIGFTRTDVFPETMVCSIHDSIVSDEEQWSNLWYIHSLDIRPRPVVDFTKNVVVAIFLGNRENRGYSALVTKVEERPTDVLVTYTEYRPTPECHPSPQAICIYAFATIPRQTKPFALQHAVQIVCK